MELTKTSFTEAVDIDRYLIMEEGIYGLTVDVKNGRVMVDTEDGAGSIRMDLNVDIIKYFAQLMVQIATDNEPEEPEDPPVEP